MFTTPCIIENQRIERAMLDLGALINVMPYYVYASLKLDPLKQIRVIIQLADHSNGYPDGVVEDVLVKINNLIFPADFYVLYMKDDTSLNPSPILLGRPFLKTSKIKIDVDKGTLTMEFDGELTKFDIFKNPIKTQDLSPVNTINMVLQVPPMSKVTIITKKKLKGRKIHKHKSIVEGTSYFPM